MTVEASKKGIKPIKSVWESFTDIERAKWNADSEILYENTNLVLESLSKNYKLGIIANQIEGLNERLHKHGIHNFFEIIVSSFDAGIKKPNSQIFEKTLQLANTTATESIYIGDRPDSDIIPAKKTWIYNHSNFKGSRAISTRTSSLLLRLCCR